MIYILKFWLTIIILLLALPVVLGMFIMALIFWDIKYIDNGMDILDIITTSFNSSWF